MQEMTEWKGAARKKHTLNRKKNYILTNFSALTEKSERVKE